MSALQAARARIATSTPASTLVTLIEHTLHLQFRSIIIWGAALGLYSAAVLAFFPSIEGDADSLVESYPEEVREVFNLNALGTVEGYLASQVFDFAPLALSFFAILTLAGVIAGAEERGTIDILLGNPLPRWQLVVGSFLAVAIALLGILFMLGVLTWIPAQLIGVDLSLATTAEATLNLWPICLFFGALALLGSAQFHRRVYPIAIPAVLLFAMYLLNVLGKIVDSLEGLRRLSAFYYYGSAIENGIDWAAFAGLTLVSALLVALAVLVFRRRDIYA